MHDSMRGYGDRNGRTTFERVAERALSYLGSRTADHWLMFLAGLVIGLIISWLRVSARVSRRTRWESSPA